VACMTAADCPVTNSQCATSVCTANSCGISFVQATTPCSQNGGTKCDGAGICR
jgi:hypothetical protein